MQIFLDKTKDNLLV